MGILILICDIYRILHNGILLAVIYTEEVRIAQ